MSPRPPTSIALFGTFDVENYGDLLFPLLVRQALCREDDVLNVFSPVGESVGWTDTIAPRPVEQAVTCRPDLCVVGGGNIISASTSPLPAYAKLGPGLPLAYASLWLGAAITAATTGSRLAWNAPGLPATVKGPWARDLCDLATMACDYLSTRDQQSKSWLQARCPVSVVPDVALGLSRLWPAKELDRHARDAFKSRDIALPERWIAFHFNSRYLDGDAGAAAASAAAIAESLDAFPVLLAIGPCHGDDVLARAISSHLKSCLVVDRPNSLRQIAALIAYSAGYIGSSLHGLITALAYRRPAIAVANTTMPKFRGFLEQVEMPQRLLESWAAAEQGAAVLLNRLSPDELTAIDQGLGDIDRHWARIRECLDRPDAEAQKARLHLLEELRRDPPRWLPWRTLQATMHGTPLPCPICGGIKFVPGPGGRMSRAGIPPQCADCGSLERHRIFRLIFDAIRTPAFDAFSCLTFSTDLSMPAERFGQHEFGIFGGSNSLDSQQIDRPNASYDVVVCDLGFEQVADYRSALRELTRITQPGGFVFLSAPPPISRENAMGRGFPGADQHGHNRVFSRDVEAVFAAETPDHRIFAVTERDPVTGVDDMAYIITRSADVGGTIAAAGVSARIVQAGHTLRLTIPNTSHPGDAADEITVLDSALKGRLTPELGRRLEEVAALRPREARPRLLLGEWFQRSGKLDSAADCFRSAMRDFPSNPWPAVRMIGLHLQRQELAQACDLYVTSVRTGLLPDSVRTVLRRDIEAAITDAGASEKLLAMLESEPVKDTAVPGRKDPRAP